MATSSSSSASAAAASSAAAYDLTGRISPYLEGQMVLPLLEFLIEKKVYNESDVMTARLDIIGKTKMVDFFAEEYKKLHEQEPTDLQSRREKVYNELSTLQKSAGPLLSIVADDSQMANLQRQHQFQLDYLGSAHAVTSTHVAELYKFAKLNFSVGNYRESSKYLHAVRLLSQNEEQRLQCEWGKLAACILAAEWDNALTAVNSVREAIDLRLHVGHQSQLQQRVWLAHWALFIFFNLDHVNGKAALIDWMMQEKMLNAICTAAPHLLRYLTACCILHRRRRNALHDLVTVLKDQRRQLAYTDPLIAFITHTHLHFDFGAASAQLKPMSALLHHDFFLSYLTNEVLEQAKLLLFETICQIHKSIDITTLARRLEVPVGEEEARLVWFIHTARVDAKIDAKNNQIVVATTFPAVYQQVIDKTKSIAYRSQQITTHIEKKMAMKDAE